MFPKSSKDGQLISYRAHAVGIEQRKPVIQAEVKISVLEPAKYIGFMRNQEYKILSN